MKKINPTPRQVNERARRKAMGIAVIQSPLRYIAENTYSIGQDSQGKSVRIESAMSMQARHAASNGDGVTVKRLARQFA